MSEGSYGSWESPVVGRGCSNHPTDTEGIKLIRGVVCKNGTQYIGVPERCSVSAYGIYPLKGVDMSSNRFWDENDKVHGECGKKIHELENKIYELEKIINELETKNADLMNEISRSIV